VAGRTLAQVVKSAKVQAGRVLGVLVGLGVDAADVVALLSRGGVPRRLLGWDRERAALRQEVERCLALSKSWAVV